MMVKLINAVTGTEMWVADNRLDEYIAAGHMPAAVPEEKPTEEPVIGTEEVILEASSEKPEEETEEVAPVQPEETSEEPKKKKTASRKK